MGHASLVAVDSTAKMEHHMVHHYLRAAQTQTVIVFGTHRLHSHQMSCGSITCIPSRELLKLVV